MKIDFTFVQMLDGFFKENAENQTIKNYLDEDKANLIYNIHHYRENNKIDFSYLNDIIMFFHDNYNRKFRVIDLTKYPDKFITHVKHYIDNRHRIIDYVDVSFNSDYTKIKIHDKRD